MKNLMQMMAEIEPGFLTGACCFLDILRVKAGMSHDKFNHAVMGLADSGKVYLEKHAHPAQLSEGEKRNYVTVGENTFIVAVIRKDAAAKVEAMERPVNRMPVEPDQAQTDEPVRKPGKGGKRPGAGRKKGTRVVSDSEKRVKLNGVRVPAWLNDWLKSRGMAGELITQALIRQHGLTPPV
ncbi:MAG: hypothetical protein AB7S77_19285 [Desulfatirhabdiaceae bacterium]